MPFPSLSGMLAEARKAIGPAVHKTEGSTVLSLRMLFRDSQTFLTFELSSSALSPNAVSTTPDTEPATPMYWEMPFRDVVQTPAEHISIQPSALNLLIPDSLIEDLRFRLAAMEGNSARQLWLKLRRPYGLLGTLPWEKELGSALKRSLLRLPDFPSRPTERPDVLESALIVDPGDDANIEDVEERLRIMISGFLKGSSRSFTRLHIFASPAWYLVLGKWKSDERVLLHDPKNALQSATAFRASLDKDEIPLRSAAWSGWIIDVMDGKSLDFIQLFCQSVWNDVRADLLLSSSPSPDETKITWVVIDPDELNLLLNRAGAWAIAFIPARTQQQYDMSYVADAFAQRRAGGVLFHPLDTPSHYETYSNACNLLFGHKRATPLFESGFLYCHPDFIHSSPNDNYSEIFSVLAENALLLAHRASVGQRLYAGFTRMLPGVATVRAQIPPNYIASAQRFLESAVFEDVRKSATDVLFSQSESAQKKQQDNINTDETLKIRNSTLGEIQGVIQDYLKTQKKEP